AIGHGSRSQMSAQQALDVARDATSIATATVDSQDPNGRKPRQTVTVTPDDTGRDPVVGQLVASDVHEIVIRRSDREIGEVCVHFPRAGYAGAKAIATSSWAVAEAQGYRDGEAIPIRLVEQIIAQIVSTIDAPVSIDFEGGYSEGNGALAENVAHLLELGIIGINFEDRVVQ